MQTYSNIFDFIKSQETAYRLPIQLTGNWSWSMKQHIETSFLYSHSQLVQGKDDFTPVKNITRPITNLAKRAEGFDVKDIVLFIDDSKKYFKSFLVKKFHEKWARENHIDTVIDSMIESYIDYGGALLKNIDDVRPEVVPLQSIVFCDQTDLLSGPIGIKHFYSPDQLLDMASKGWGNKNKGATHSLQEVIALSREQKDINSSPTKTPGKYIEVYEIHGQFPKFFLDSNESLEEYSSQLHIVCFYESNGEKQGITLFKSQETISPFKFIARDPIFGRALGFGGAEELFDPQVWVNYDVKRKLDMLDSASKTLLKSTDPAVTQKQKVRDMDNLEVIDLAPGTDISQIDTFPRNIAIFDRAVNEWEAHAQQMGAANDAIMGQSPASGTPFRLQELVTQEAHSLHEYRKGKLATFWDEVEKDWIIPHLIRELAKGQEFLAELDLGELQYVSDALVTCETNKFIKQKILSGELFDPAEIDGYKEIVRGEFKKKGNKHFIQVLEGELKNAPISVYINIIGKQKYLSLMVDKLTNLFKTIMVNPAILQNKAMAKLFNDIVESSGLDPVDFSDFEMSQSVQSAPAQSSQPSPIQQPQLSQLTSQPY